MSKRKFVDTWIKYDHPIAWPDVETGGAISVALRRVYYRQGYNRTTPRLTTEITGTVAKFPPSKTAKKAFSVALRGRVHEWRDAYRHKRFSFDNPRRTYMPSRIGGVYQTVGAFLNKGLAYEIRKEKARITKKPKSKIKHVGIEFECVIPDLEQEQLIEKIIEAKLEDYLSVGTDGSIKGDRTDNHETDCDVELSGLCQCGRKQFTGRVRAWEIRALIPQKDLQPALKRICPFFEKLGAITNYSCGMHVHLDMRHRDADRAARNLILSQKILYSLVPKYRRKSTYCEPSMILCEPKKNGRRGINVTALDKHSTIEVRIHHGCLNFAKILAWVRLLVAIADAPRFSQPINTISQFRRRIAMPSKRRLFLLKRIERFGGITPQKFPVSEKKWLEKFPAPKPPEPMSIETQNRLAQMAQAGSIYTYVPPAPPPPNRQSWAFLGLPLI